MGGLGWSAVTLASHVTIILSVVFAFSNALAVRRYWGEQSPVSLLDRLENPIFAIGIALVVERSYYVAARLLVNTPLDLWEQHPAPEFLSVIFSASIFWLAIEIRKIAIGTELSIQPVIRVQCCIVAGVFVLLAGGLY